MKKINYLLTLCLLYFGLVTFAQKENVGIGTTKPDQSALLDLSSQTKGLLTPRMSLEQRGNIQNPANGLMVYQTDFLSGFYYFDGKEWKSMTNATNASSVAGVDGDWDLTGNLSTTPFHQTTNPTGNAVGTKGPQALAFMVNGLQSGLLDFNGLTFFGYLAGRDNTTGLGNTAIGKNALRANTSGSANVAIGGDALGSSLTGNGNLGIGNGALANSNGAASNVAMGSQALFNTTVGSFNTGIGYKANFQNTGGSHNVGIGYGALYSTTGSNSNTAIGNFALHNANTTGSNTAIGYESGFNNAGQYNIFIGNRAGYNEAGSEKLYIANSSTNTPLVYGDFTTKYLAVGEVATADRAAATSGGYRLLVKGGMITEKIKVAVAGSADWADYVFEPSYKLMSLDKVESFVKENKHLPNVPSAEEMSKNGLDVMQTSAKLMEKIEELTLYMIEMNKEIQALKTENAKLKK